MSLIQINGYSIRFVLDEKYVELAPKDLIEDIYGVALIWMLIPGSLILLLLAPLLMNTTIHEEFETPLTEYYSLCGYHIASKEKMPYQKYHQESFQFFSQLPSLKTSDINQFARASIARYLNHELISDYYGKDCWLSKSKFQVYVKKQKATYEISNRLFHGSKKYDKDNIVGSKQKNDFKWVSSPPENHDAKSRMPIIAYGNATFSSSMRGEVVAPTKRITQAIRKLANTMAKLNLFM
ncbi:hypothetical protein A0J61_00931 [Choanephora cucurbitarum]|uniref:Uncharacterized protein n=1 Tax=Choanephora cucurbitarum TaxID=101091 RepID=A0A1C7NPF9_9FUNG|nr:hypothetical protein A0J61_00931 [Choanephora cucurbitarum]